MFCDKCGAENRNEAEFCINCGSKLPRDITPVKPSVTSDKPQGGGETDYVEGFKSAISHRYKIIRELGRGGMAIVFLAEDNRLERKVALKLLPQELSYDKNFAERFLREAKIAAKLLNPNIIQIHDVDTSGGFYYYSMAYIEGISLDQIIKKSGALKPRVIARIAVLVSFALQQAHEKGVIHRDIKPENIMINKKRQPIVVDFGIAKAQRSAKLSQTGMFIGTPMYMSPEQIRGEEKIDGRADIYSMGCVLYQMATGKTPFQGVSHTALLYKQVNELPPPPREIDKNVPKSLSDIIMKALAKNPEDRFQSAADLGKALHEAILAKPSEKSKAAAAEPSVRKEATPETSEERKQPIAETFVQSSETSRIEEALEEAAKEKSGREPGKLGDTLVAPAHRLPKKKVVKKIPEKKKHHVLSLVAMLILSVIVMFAFYRLLPKKDKNVDTAQSPTQDTVQRAEKPPQPVTKADEIKPKKTPESRTPIEHGTSRQQRSASVPPGRDTVKQAPTPQQTGKTSAKIAQQPKAPVQKPIVEEKQRTFAPKEREPAPELPLVKKPDRKVVERKTAPPAVRDEQPKETPVAILVKPEITPEKKIEKPVDLSKESAQIIWMKIPGGTFMMGDSRGDIDDKFMCRPAHRVTVSPFLISKNEITVAQYARFIRVKGWNEPPLWSKQLENSERPVINVSWNDADAFARWAGARLPTEAEWEFAARGGLEGNLYTWGNENPKNQANYGNKWDGGNGWVTALKKPGSYPPNGYGLNDMAGNVWEWCADWFGPYQSGLVINPTGVSSGRGRVIRGGGWNSGNKQIRSSFRLGPADPRVKGTHTGFRIAKSVK